jgi:signal transduction histidine kinase
MGASVTGSGDTDLMMTRVFLLIRTVAFALIGLLALIGPPHSHTDRVIQISCFVAVGVALVGCLVADRFPRLRPWLLPVALCLMAAAGGLTAVTAGNGQSLVAFAGIAAVMAGDELELAPAEAVAATGICTILIAGPIAGSNWGTLTGYPLLIVACLLLGRNRRGYRVQAEQAAALYEEKERMRAEQRRADVLDERARIAREIHDVLAHSLGALGIQIQAAKAMLTDRADIDGAVGALSTAQRMAADGLAETRRAVHALRVDTLPLGEELAGVAETHQHRYRVPVIYETAGEPRTLPSDVSLALLRAGQEALVNAAKHAPGQPVTVRLDYADADVRLTVGNRLDGTARHDISPGESGGYGLTGMRERLRLLNGTLQAGPRDGQWIVIADVPLTAGLTPAAEDVTVR